MTKPESEQAAREWVDTWKPANPQDTDSYGVYAFKAGQAHERERLKQKALAYKSGVGAGPPYMQGHWDGQKALFEHLFGEEQA